MSVKCLGINTYPTIKSLYNGTGLNLPNGMSHTNSFICCSSIESIRERDSTSKVKTEEGGKCLSVNWDNKHDLPTAVSPIITYLNTYE